MTPIIIILFLVVCMWTWGLPYPLRLLLIQVLQKMGHEEFIKKLNGNGSIRKEHSRSYWFCISAKRGKHYRFAKNEATDHYFCDLPGYAYLGQLLPERWPQRKCAEYYYFFKIPRNQNEADEIKNYLESQQKFPVTLTDKETTALVQPNFDITASMTWWQKICWNLAHVYWFKDWNFTIHPELKPVSFTRIKPVETDEDSAENPKPKEKPGEIEFEQREEMSMNLVAMSFQYVLIMNNLADRTSIPLSIQFTITARNNNPWFSDFEQDGGFDQLIVLIRGVATNVVSQYAFLAIPAGLTEINDYMRSLFIVLKDGDKNALSEIKPVEVPKEPTSGKAGRLVQLFNDALLDELRKPEHYMGYTFEDQVNVLDVRPYGDKEDIDKVLTIESKAATAQQENAANLSRTFSEMFEGLAKNKVEDNNGRLRIEREGLEIERNATADATKDTVFYKALVKTFKEEKALQIIELLAKYKAIAETKGQLYMGFDNNKDNVLLANLTEFLSKQNKQKGDSK